MSLLKWLIKKDHITLVDPKSNAAVFYDRHAFDKQTLITDSEKTVPDKCLADFLSPAELNTGKTIPQMLEQTDWRKNYAKLRVKFVTDKFMRNIKAGQTVFIFSEPVFLNTQKTKVLIGEYFFCGMACGRDDLLLCEFKNGRWQLIARAVINND